MFGKQALFRIASVLLLAGLSSCEDVHVQVQALEVRDPILCRIAAKDLLVGADRRYVSSLLDSAVRTRDGVIYIRGLEPRLRRAVFRSEQYSLERIELSPNSDGTRHFVLQGKHGSQVRVLAHHCERR